MWNYVYPSYELYHHGVRGQKWGKKNGPPYPLAASAHSASEKKAGWKKSLSGSSGDKVRYGSQSTSNNIATYEKKLNNAKANYAERKSSYKEAVRDYRLAKKEARYAEEDLNIAANDVEFAKQKIKDDKLSVKMEKASGNGRAAVKNAKRQLDFSENEYDRAVLNENRLYDVYMKKLDDVDAAYGKKVAEKALLKEGKKALREEKKALREAKREYRNFVNSHYLDDDSSSNNSKDKKSIKYGNQFNADNAKRDAYSDVNRMMGGNILSRTPDGQKLNNKRDREYMKRVPYDTVDSLYTRGSKKAGGTKASESYAREYSKAFDEAVDLVRNNKYQKLTNKGKERLRVVEDKKPNFITQKGSNSESKLASRVKQMRASGKTYAQISDALQISEASVGNLLKGKYK